MERKSDLASGKARARFLTPLSLMEEGRQVVFVTRLSDGRYATRAAGGSWGLWDVDGRAVLGNDPCQSASEMKEAQNEYEQRAHGNVSAAGAHPTIVHPPRFSGTASPKHATDWSVFSNSVVTLSLHAAD